MKTSDIIGYIAMILSAVAYLPQVWHLWKEKSAKGICLKSYILLIVGTVAWLCYGIALKEWPIIMANIIMLGSMCSILGLKIFIDRKK